jgi:hypothetical protein
MNTLHPPPLNGKQQQRQEKQQPSKFLSDEENGANQMEFFSQVAQQHFGVVRETTSRKAPSQTTTALLSAFLTRTATSHMGWRGGTTS